MIDPKDVPMSPEAESLHRELCGRIDQINSISSALNYYLKEKRSSTRFVDYEAKPESEYHNTGAHRIALLNVELEKLTIGFNKLTKLCSNAVAMFNAEHATADEQADADSTRQ